MFTVYVEDPIKSGRVCILDMATRTEAMDVVNYISKFSNCTVYIVQNEFVDRRTNNDL